MIISDIDSSFVRMVTDIYDKHQSVDFIKDSHQVLSKIHEGISALEHELGQLPESLEFVQMWHKIDNPSYLLMNKYDQLIQGIVPEDVEGECNAVHDALWNIHLALCGRIEEHRNAIELYLEAMIESSLISTSTVHQIYRGYTDIFLLSILRGFVLLGAYADSRFENWKENLTVGDVGADENYLKRPYLKEQWSYCKKLIESRNHEKDQWAGKSNLPVFEYDTDSIYLDGSFNIPKHHVITGVDFYLNPDKVLVPVAWYGKLNSSGDVEVPLPAQSASGKPEPIVNDDVSVYYIDTEEIKVPEGCVVLDYKWSRKQGILKESAEHTKFYLYFLLVKYSPLILNEEKTQILGEEVWISNDRDMETLGDQLSKKSELPSGIVLGEKPMECKHWSRWMNNITLSPPETWDIPITGIHISDGKLIFRNGFNVIETQST